MSTDVAPAAGSSGDVLDRARIEELYSHIDDLVSFLVGTRDVHVHDAEEIVSSIFDKLLAEAAAGTPVVTNPGVPLLSFLKTMARNGLDHYAKRHERRNVPLSHLDVQEPRDPAQRRPLSVIDARQRVDAAKAAWDALPERTRALLELVDFKDVPIREAARSLSIPERHAYDLYEDTKRRLERELGKTWSTYIQPLPAGEYKPRSRRAFLGHIEELPREHREILTLIHVDGRTELEAAQVLRCSTEDLRSRLHHAEELLSRKTGCTMDEVRTFLMRSRRE